jgi:hypothetical protein
VSGPLFRYLWRRHALPCAACALAPILIGLAVGALWPDYRQQAHLIGGLFKFANQLLRSDLLAPDSASFFFQLPFAHPLTMLALMLSVSIPTLALPATARGRGSLDLLLASGLTRRRMVATTSLFTLPFALLLSLAPLAGTFAGAAISHVTNELDFAAFARVALEAFVLALFFAGLAQLLSVACNDLFGAAWRLAAIVFWSLLAEITGTVWQAGRFLKYMSPFGYYEPAQVLAGVARFGRDSSILLCGGLLFFASAFVVAQRRKSA